MPLSINTNIASLTAQRSLSSSNAALETSFERLSTGKRINSAVDDAAGLAIAKDLESRVSGLNQAVRNVNDGISMVQITEGTLDEVTTILQRMRDLAVQASNDSLGSTERGYLDTEHEKLASSLDTALNSAMFNDTDLIAAADQTFTIQSGATASDTTAVTIQAVSASSLSVAASDIDLDASKETVTVTVSNTQAGQTTAANFIVGGTTASITISTSTTEGVVAALNASTNATLSALTWSNSDDTITGTYDSYGAKSTATFSFANGTSSVTGSVTAGTDFGLKAIDDALTAIAEDRANLGAVQSQLESTVRNLANVAENTAAAAGRIMDTDYAAETANLTKAQILQQAATSILAQANAQPQSVLSLLQ
jgi:flagellin